MRYAVAQFVKGKWRRLRDKSDGDRAFSAKQVKWIRRHTNDKHLRVATIEDDQTTRASIVRIAAGQVGVVEHPPNSNNGVAVRQYQAATSLPPPRPGTQGWPYCQAFVCWVCRQAGAPLGYTGAYVPSFEAWARHKGKWRGPSVTPRPGWAVAFDFDGDGVADHVGIVTSVTPGAVNTIEGNTSPDDQGSQANGGGVYRRKRTRSVIRGFVVLGADNA